jgi:hypothetical protein
MRASAAVVAIGALLAAAARAAAQRACYGEFSLCNATSSCALVEEQCGQCGAGLYACPMSTACFGPNPDAFSTCPGLAGTHFDSTLSIEARLDYIFNQSLTLAEMISQLTDNATQIPRLAIVSVCLCVCCVWKGRGTRSRLASC